eukprot:7450830-Pyramimonas_sp.AAC.2
MSERQGTTITLIRGVEVPRKSTMHDSGSSRRNRNGDPRRRRPRMACWPKFPSSRRLFSNGPLPSMIMNR